MGIDRKAIVWMAVVAATLSVSEAEAQQTQERSVILPPVTVQQPNRPARRVASRPRTVRPALAPAVPVRTARATRATGNTTESYLSQRSATATKTDTPVLETPQSISTVTRRQMDDQNVQTVGNALRYTAGVLSDADTNARYDSIFMRGFGAFGTDTSYVSFLDGLKLPRGQGFAIAAIDPFLLDRVDVLKGPSAML